MQKCFRPMTAQPMKKLQLHRSKCLQQGWIAKQRQHLHNALKYILMEAIQAMKGLKSCELAHLTLNLGGQPVCEMSPVSRQLPEQSRLCLPCSNKHLLPTIACTSHHKNIRGYRKCLYVSACGFPMLQATSSSNGRL